MQGPAAHSLPPPAYSLLLTLCFITEASARSPGHKGLSLSLSLSLKYLHGHPLGPKISLRALRIRIGFKCPLYYNCSKEPPNIVLVIISAPIVSSHDTPHSIVILTDRFKRNPIVIFQAPILCGFLPPKLSKLLRHLPLLSPSCQESSWGTGRPD